MKSNNKSYSKESRGHRAGSDLRRQRAADRFGIMSFAAWGIAHQRLGRPSNQRDYAAYRSQKIVEAKALGLDAYADREEV